MNLLATLRRILSKFMPARNSTVGEAKLHSNRRIPNLAPIPMDIQFEAACSIDFREMQRLLGPFGFEWNPHISSLNYSDYKYLFTFTADDLLAYLCQHPEICEKLLMQSYDKRYSPSTFIQEWEGGKYRVGWYDNGYYQLQIFDRFEEAATDYVLFSWGFPRLCPSG